MEKQNANARRLYAAAMPERWPQVCRVKITFELLLTSFPQGRIRSNAL